MDRPLTLIFAALGGLLVLAVPARAEEPVPEPSPPPTATTLTPTDRPPPTWGLEGPNRFEVGASLGYAHRAGGSPVFAETGDSGISGGLQIRLFTSERVGFGLGYEHVGLWSESSGVLETGSFELTRRLDTLVATVRLRPFYGDALGAFIDLGAGPSWQGLSLRGSAWSAVTPGVQVPVQCDGGGKIGFAFRTQVGVEAPISDAFRAELGLGLDLYRHGDGLVGNCAPGIGSVVAPGLRLSFLYGFGL
ncbi:MAG: hypothetical protein RIF41_35675 [Polyangiaceae bacterium]